MATDNQEVNHEAIKGSLSQGSFQTIEAFTQISHLKQLEVGNRGMQGGGRRGEARENSNLERSCEPEVAVSPGSTCINHSTMTFINS